LKLENRGQLNNTEKPKKKSLVHIVIKYFHGKVIACIFKEILEIKGYILACYEIMAYFEYILGIFTNILSVLCVYSHN
jgi:hypothetical protein